MIENEKESINKNEIVMIKNYEFFVKNSEPLSGILSKETKVTIENREILNIQKLQIAVIKKNLQEYGFEEEKLFQEYVHQQIYKPYFLSGVTRFVERGDIIKVEEVEFCILNCIPEEGFISKDTQLSLLFGMSTEKCLEKIKNADMKYAMQLSRQYDLQTANISSEVRFDMDSTEDNLDFIDSSNSNLSNYHLGSNPNSSSNNSSNMINLSLNDNGRIIFNSNNVGNLVTRMIDRNSEDRALIRRVINHRRNSNPNNPVLREESNSNTINRNLITQLNSVNLEDENNNIISSISNLNDENDVNMAHEYDLQMFIYSLPELIVDKSYLNYIESKKLDLENITKCMICYSDFELNEVLKTLPCSKLIYLLLIIHIIIYSTFISF
jgi:hypothetical protein